MPSSAVVYGILIILLRIFCRIVRVRDRSNKNITVLQNYFPVNLHDWMTDSDSVSDAKMESERRLCARSRHSTTDLCIFSSLLKSGRDLADVGRLTGCDLICNEFFGPKLA